MLEMIGHAGADQRAQLVHPLMMLAAPVHELAPGNARLGGKSLNAVLLGEPAHRCANQVFFLPEMPEQGDFVDARFLRDAARAGGLGAAFGKQLHSGAEQRLAH
jgi:hypothetical protein